MVPEHICNPTIGGTEIWEGWESKTQNIPGSTLSNEDLCTLFSAAAITATAHYEQSSMIHFTFSGNIPYKGKEYIKISDLTNLQHENLHRSEDSSD